MVDKNHSQGAFATRLSNHHALKQTNQNQVKQIVNWHFSGAENVNTSIQKETTWEERGASVAIFANLAFHAACQQS